MSSRWSELLLVLLVATSATAGEPRELRVCGDPGNLPFSNDRLEGLENRIADVIAKDLGARVVYTWWPHQRGVIKRALNAGRCDVLLGIPKGYDPVLWTRSYYRTGYVIATRADRPLTSLDDPALKRSIIGVTLGTPAHDALAERGLLGDNVVTYPLSLEWHGQVMDDLIAGKIDVAMVWGPVAGWFAKKRSAPVVITPLESAAFDISMGVRKGDKALKAELEEVLGRRHDEIQRILEEYGVPLL
jgi:mxaJ protein